jgi:WD40 repeat protein
VVVIDVASGNAITSWAYPPNKAKYHQFSPDGRFVVATDMVTEMNFAVIPVDQPGNAVYSWVRPPVFSPGGQWLLRPDETGGAAMDTEMLAVRKVFSHPGDSHDQHHFRFRSPTSTFSPDSRTVTMTGLQHEFTASPVDEWRAGRFTFTGAKKVRPVARAWDVETGQELLEIPGCTSALCSPNGKSLAAVGEDGEISIWDMPPHRPWGTITLAATGLWALSLLTLWLIRIGVRW